jgi:hypothetical protein
MTKTLAQHAETLNIPLRTVADVEAAILQAQAKKADRSLARLMLNHGRLTPDARAFVERYLAA